MVEVEITVLAITQRYGSLPAGTVLHTDEAYAEHLVKEANCAKYRKPAVVVDAAAKATALAAAPATASRRRRAEPAQGAGAAPEKPPSAPAPGAAKSTLPADDGAELPGASSDALAEQKTEGGLDQPSDAAEQPSADS